MRPPWKVIGLAGLAGVAATGVVVARNRRAHRDYDPDELRDRLHRRLAEASSAGGEPPQQAAGDTDGRAVSRARRLADLVRRRFRRAAKA